MILLLQDSLRKREETLLRFMLQLPKVLSFMCEIPMRQVAYDPGLCSFKFMVVSCFWRFEMLWQHLVLLDTMILL
jgi:hypothetical protein